MKRRLLGQSNVTRIGLLRMAKDIVESLPDTDIFTNSFNRQAFNCKHKRDLARKRLIKIGNLGSGKIPCVKKITKKELSLRFGLGIGRFLGSTV